MPSHFMQAGAKIVLPTTGVARNVLTKMDDHGYYASLSRIDGESLTNYKVRMASSYTRKANATTIGMTDAIARELSLGHENLIAITSSASLRLDVQPEFIRVSGVGTYGEQKVDIVDVDVDGYWNMPTIGKVVSGLNLISGISAVAGTGMETTPAVLLEEQSSYVTEYDERIPPSTSFKLGYWKYGQELAGTVLSGTISFTDDISFATEVSGTPQTMGEWSFNQDNNSIQVFSLPRGPVHVIYTYNLLESGLTMNLVGNGVKVMNLIQSEVQHMLFHNSGIGATARTIVDELRSVDGAFWGK